MMPHGRGVADRRRTDPPRLPTRRGPALPILLSLLLWTLAAIGALHLAARIFA